MGTRTAVEAHKKSQTTPVNTTWQHTAVRPMPEQEMLTPQHTPNLKSDFTQIPAQTTVPITTPVSQTTACPMFPRTCPFGGACHTCPPRVQTKLTINQPGDKYEEEADRVADQIMRMPDPKTSVSEEASEQVQRAPLSIQRHATSQTTPPTAPLIVHEVLASPGRPLANATRAFMEPRFGRDFSQVRVHTGAKASESARAVNALGYTVGQDVVFGADQYSPASRKGQQLLAHELTHVVQQSCGKGQAALMRWSYGTGTPPLAHYSEISDEDKPIVEASKSIVSRVVNDSRNYRRCHNRFQSLCPSPSAHELLDRFNAAVLWMRPDDPTYYYGGSVTPDHVAFTPRTLRIGRWMAANTAIHEFVHRCGYHNETEINRTAEVCGMPRKPY